MDKETKREIILDNYQHPMNRGLKEDESYVKANTRSDSCIDNIDLMMKIEDGRYLMLVLMGKHVQYVQVQQV